jgi:hypothetical protein
MGELVVTWDELVDSWEVMFGKRALVKAGEAARFLGWDRRSLLRRVDEGLLAPVFVDGQRRFFKADVLRLVKC